MSAAEYSWHADAWQLAQAAVARGAHALLIAGARGVGKRELAMRLVACVLCERRGPDASPCGACESCRWFLAGTHPDFALLEPLRDEPEGEGAGRGPATAREHPINVDQIRRLGESLALSSHRDSGKVVVVYPAEAMNAAAANALLKNLEEPPSRTLFILAAHRPALLPPTVLSRCQKIHVKVTNARAAERWLEAQGVENAALHLALCGGAPLEALTSVTDTLNAHRPQLLQSLCEKGVDALALAERFRDLPPAALLAWLQKFTFDLLHVRFFDRARYHLDLSDLARRCASRVDVHALARLHRRLLAQQRHIHHPLNPRLLIEQLLIDCCRVLSGAEGRAA